MALRPSRSLRASSDEGDKQASRRGPRGPARPRATRCLIVAYDGAAFHGFRRQAEGPTVEDVLARAVEAATGARPRIDVAGATDRGVHALAQVVSFHTRSTVEERRLRAALETLIPPRRAPSPFAELEEALGDRALVVRASAAVPRSFHASFSATARRYRYHLAQAVDRAALAAMLGALRGERCFSAFARDTPAGARTVKHLYEARVVADGTSTVVELAASGFLRRQVRVLIATALRELARGAGPEALVDLARRGVRSETAPPAAADRLCLAGVDYPSDSGAPSLRASTALSVDRSSSPDAAASQRSPS